MRRVQVVAVGRIKEGFVREGIAEYAKRLRAYTQFEEVVVREEPYREQDSDTIKERVKEREGDALLKASHGSYRVALDRTGRLMTSEELASLFEQVQHEGRPAVAFLIGGSLGLAPHVLKEADLVLSFGRFTFPHGLMRLILMEQIYRAFTILKGEPYHK